ncbi:hypothetical protein HHK36_019227 [Tetracentron sinense]|uniref:Uncharacterized protein n=1 Tax=Tetracentron sinense TaxID=13715 RepID=A0A835DCK9_TETSI|nr:hypothetical protein HHK36_019227 [Tetracentron sinense]
MQGHCKCMDNQRRPLSWAYSHQGKSMEELRHSLLYTTLELETTRLVAEEEIRRREDQVTYLNDLLTRTTRERDEAQDKCQKLLVEKLLLQQQYQNQQTAPLSGISSIGYEPRSGLSSSDGEESIMSSPVMADAVPQTRTVQLGPDNLLPEKGKLLQAVMKAGPLLQTLLLAGPLPQWRHPPPPLDSFEIPTVAIPSSPPNLLHQDSSSIKNGCNSNTTNNICGTINKKRSLVSFEGSDSSTNTKYQRVVLH